MATPGADEIVFEILDDGMVKMTTDPISEANHVNAEKLLGTLQATLGGEATREKRRTGKTHAHVDAHGHRHEHAH